MKDKEVILWCRPATKKRIKAMAAREGKTMISWLEDVARRHDKQKDKYNEMSFFK